MCTVPLPEESVKKNVKVWYLGDLYNNQRQSTKNRLHQIISNERIIETRTNMHHIGNIVNAGLITITVW